MYIEAKGRLPQPIPEQERGQIRIKLQRTAVLQNSPFWDRVGLFKVGERSPFTRQNYGVYHNLWSSKALDFWPSSVYAKEVVSVDIHRETPQTWIQIHRVADPLKTPLEIMHPVDLRFYKSDGNYTGKSVVNDGGFIPSPNGNNLPLEEVRQEIEKGKKSRFWGRRVAVLRAVDPEMIGREVFVTELDWLTNCYKFDAVVIDLQTGTLVEREIIYPWLDEDKAAVS